MNVPGKAIDKAVGKPLLGGSVCFEHLRSRDELVMRFANVNINYRVANNIREISYVIWLARSSPKTRKLEKITKGAQDPHQLEF